MGRSDASLLLKLFGIVVYNIFVWKKYQNNYFLYIFLIFNITYKNHKKNIKKQKLQNPQTLKTLEYHGL
jgi:hypothetical protein